MHRKAFNHNKKYYVRISVIGHKSAAQLVHLFPSWIARERYISPWEFIAVGLTIIAIIIYLLFIAVIIIAVTIILLTDWFLLFLFHF